MKRAVRVFALVGVLFLGSWAGTPQTGSPPIKGVWYTGFERDSYSSASVASDLRTLKDRLATNHVVITVPVFQANLKANNPAADPVRTPSDAVIRTVVEQAHRLGLAVVLIPYLLVDDGQWVGDLAPTNVSQWFQNWRAILRRYAQLAQQANVEIFLLGWEFVTMQKYQAEWERAIQQIRPLYRGRLSYFANWWWDRRTYANVFAWKPWGSLDFIGISAFFELTRKNDPTVTELQRAWNSDAHGQNILEDLARLHSEYRKCIVFLELGYESKDGTNREPWNFLRTGPPDEGEQRDAFQAVFRALSDQPWFGGYLVWAEQPGLPRTATGYDVLTKPAAEIIRAHAMPSTSCPGARP